jgi:hypothetical protein
MSRAHIGAKGGRRENSAFECLPAYAERKCGFFSPLANSRYTDDDLLSVGVPSCFQDETRSVLSNRQHMRKSKPKSHFFGWKPLSQIFRLVAHRAFCPRDMDKSKKTA